MEVNYDKGGVCGRRRVSRRHTDIWRKIVMTCWQTFVWWARMETNDLSGLIRCTNVHGDERM